MRKPTARWAPTLVVVLGLLAGCGDSAEAADPPADTAAALTDEERLASIEGSWMCDVQRFAFDDLSEIDAKLDTRLADEGFDRDAYDGFKTELSRRPDLRQLVLDTFNETCIG